MRKPFRGTFHKNGGEYQPYGEIFSCEGEDVQKLFFYDDRFPEIQQHTVWPVTSIAREMLAVQP